MTRIIAEINFIARAVVIAIQATWPTWLGGKVWTAEMIDDAAEWVLAPVERLGL